MFLDCRAEFVIDFKLEVHRSGITSHFRLNVISTACAKGLIVVYLWW